MMLKWCFDRFTALVGLLALTPVYAAIALSVAISMPGHPVLFTQKRVGRHGRLFKIYKFCTMYDHPEGNTVSVAGESRITPLGAKLRKYKLDELPELWNVLKGDMSFVGPRPDVPGYADCLEGDARRILDLRPGITGPASLKYRNEEQLLATVPNPQEYNDTVIYPDKVRINLEYLDNQSFIGDIRLIFATIFSA